MPSEFLGDDVLLLEARLDGPRANRAALFLESYWGDLHDSGLYRPLSLVFLSVQRDAFGLDPVPYRIVNLLLHGLCCLLAMRLLSRYVAGRGAFWGALLFAVHPMHAEAVTTVYGQQDLLAAVFFLAALLVATGSQATRPVVKFSIVGFLYLLSLLSKEQGVLLPLLLLLLSQPGQVTAWRFSVRREHCVLLLPLLIYATLRLGALGTQPLPGGEASIAYGYPWWARVNLVIVTLGTYVRLLMLPWGQTTYYGHLRDSIFGYPWLEAMWVLAPVLLIPRLQYLLGRSIVWLAIAFLVATLLPVANLIPIGVVVAERCLYLPVFAVCLLGAAAIQQAGETRAQVAVALASTLVVTGLVLSARVALRWRTPLTHWQTTAADHPRSAGAHARYALLLLHQAATDGARPNDARLGQAEQAIERALLINGRSPEAWQARGILSLIRGDCGTAAPALDRALALRPGDREIAVLRRKCP